MTARRNAANAAPGATATADRRSGAGPWRPPTRRAFVAALGAAAAALAVRDRTHERGACGDDDDRPRSTWTGTTRWIGHC